MRYDFDPNSPEAGFVLGELEASELSIDTETTGLEEHDRLFCVTISTDRHQFYITRENLGGLRDVFADPNKLWFMQNAKFDMRMLANEGYPLQGRVTDITVMARLVRNDHLVYSLESQAVRFGEKKLDLVKKEIVEKKLYDIRPRRIGPPDKVPRYDWVNQGLLKVYACVDASLTYKMAQKYKSEFSEIDGNHWRVWNNENELTKVCFNMERRGMCIDVNYTRAGYAFQELQSARLKKDFKAQTGLDFVDSAKLFEPIFTNLGEQIQRTAKGNPSFTGDVLEKYRHPLAELVLEIRSSEKTITTYYTNFINMYVTHKDLPEHCGVIHPSMWQAGTKTGRFSYSDPNLQQLTKDEDSKDEYVVRGCFVPRPGKAFLAIDFSQQEYRLMLAYANETALIKAVMDGADVHQATADLLGINRQQAKTLNFAILYGAGVEKISKMLKCSVADARRFKLLYFMKLPKVEQFIDEVIRKGRSRGFVHNWFGRRLYTTREHAYALPNHIIQSSGADVIKLSMNRIGPDAPMVLQVHDELIFEVDPSEVEEKAKLYKGIMESAFPAKNGMTLTTEATYSTKSLAKRDFIKI